jgi:hypothetical protein
MFEALNTLLEDFGFKSFKGSLNYCANLALYEVKNATGENIEIVVAKALRKPVSLGNYRSCQTEEVVQEVQASLEFRGDESSHPSFEFLDSQEFLTMQHQILELLQRLLSDSTTIIGFYFKDGHPFYPVFWDYAYVIEHQKHTYVLVGSSSD